MKIHIELDRGRRFKFMWHYWYDFVTYWLPFHFTHNYENSKFIRAENFRMVDIEINAW